MKVMTAVHRGTPALTMLALCIILVVSPAAVSAQSSEFSVDVWTSKGGQGFGASGGSFADDEELVVYIWASHDCYASIAIGPSEGEPSTYFDAELQGGETVSIVPKQTGVDLTGSWAVMVDAVSVSGSVLSSDYVLFSIAGAAAGTSPTSPPVTPAVASDSATALDALIALKMAEGTIPVEAEYDVNGDGQVTVDDARQILHWAVQ